MGAATDNFVFLRDEWAAASRFERTYYVGCSGFILAVFIALGIAAGRTFPVEEQRVVVEVVQEKIEQVYVPVPTDIVYPPLDKPEQACAGNPVVVKNMRVSGSQQEPDRTFTFFTVRPAGDEYMFQCNMSGDYSNQFHVGDLVVLTGSVTGG